MGYVQCIAAQPQRQPRTSLAGGPAPQVELDTGVPEPQALLLMLLHTGLWPWRLPSPVGAPPGGVQGGRQCPLLASEQSWGRRPQPASPSGPGPRPGLHRSSLTRLQAKSRFHRCRLDGGQPVASHLKHRCVLPAGWPP